MKFNQSHLLSIDFLERDDFWSDIYVDIMIKFKLIIPKFLDEYVGYDFPSILLPHHYLHD